MKKPNLRTVIIGLLISWSTEIFIPFIQTMLDFTIRPNLRYPLTHYLLWGYLPVVLSGIYVGLSKTNNKIINGFLVGVFYYVIFSLFVGIVINRHFGDSFFLFGYAILMRGIICGAVAWSAYKVRVRLNDKKSGRKR
jgi:hypothetical protein